MASSLTLEKKKNGPTTQKPRLSTPLINGAASQQQSQQDYYDAEYLAH
jgi:hypothetical protein